jgi:hypothetical protein
MLTDVATVGEGFGQLGTETSHKVKRYGVFCICVDSRGTRERYGA